MNGYSMSLIVGTVPAKRHFFMLFMEVGHAALY